MLLASYQANQVVQIHQSVDSKDLSGKSLLGEWLIKEPYALMGHVWFYEGILRLEPLAQKYR